MRRVFLAAVLLHFVCQLFATTISPYKDLGELSYAADAIYYARAIDITQEIEGENLSYFQNFEILQTIKGENREHIPVRYFSEIKLGQYRSVAGEVKFNEGSTYLLFLRQTPNGNWITSCVSYYLFEEQEVKGESVLVPIYQQGLLNIAEVEQQAEPLYVYHTAELLSELRSVVTFEKNWEAKNAKASNKFTNIESVAHKAIPSHCNLFPVNPPPRWQNMETQPLPVYYESSGSGCSNIANEMNTAVDYLTSNYLGVNMNIGGSFNNYNPNCAGGSASNGNFTSFVDNNLNGERSIAVIFDDPCNQIPNLSGCNGLLALGGLFFFTGTTHQYNGELYSKTAYGYVIVNNGAGACNCGVFTGNNVESNFTLLMTHELTHAIGFFHMDPSVTQANMAGVSCCASASISNLDLACVNHVYNVAPIPGCTDQAAENYDPSAVNDDNSCTYCSNGIRDGDEAGVDCGGSGPNCPNCLPDLVMQDCGTMVISPDNIAVSSIEVRNNGSGSSGASTLGYFLSTNTSITTSDILITTDFVTGLNPGQVSSENFNVIIDNLNLAPGQYYVGMIADYNSQLNETNEFNNTCFFSSPRLVISSCDDGIQNGDETGVDCGGSCTGCFSDLVVDNCGTVNITNTNISGSGIVVKNEGDANSPAVRLGYYLSMNRTITTSDIFIGSDFVGALAPGSTSNESFNFSLSNYDIPFGEYYLGMIVDYQQVDNNELSETNNTCHVTNPRLTVFDCEDGMLNGGETGVDCGGPYCQACDCMANKTYTSDIVNDDVRNANSFVRTSGEVSVRNSAKVYWSATNKLELKPGFEVVSGSVIVLTAQNCAN